MLTWITIAAIAFLVASYNMYRQEVIIPTRQEQEAEQLEASRQEDIETLIETALRGE